MELDLESCRMLIDSNFIGGCLRFMRKRGTLVWNCICCFNQAHFLEVITEEIKEIRLLEKNQIQMFYGSNFILDFVQFECYSLSDRNLLVWKLNREIKENKYSSYKSKLDKYLIKKINSFKKIKDTNDETELSIREARNFFKEVDLNVSKMKLFKVYYENSFLLVMKNLINLVHEEIICKQKAILEFRCEDSPSLKSEYISSSQQMMFQSFKNFLIEKQGLLLIHTSEESQVLLKNLLMGANEDFLSQSEFLNHLFSEQNEIMDEIFLQDMSKPLSHYFIASSHNTYLTGDQITSLSSEEAYARVLRQGCRCIELDCWPSQDKIIITHGFTLTSKISFESVLNTIKLHAFAVTEYPLILFIENHCPVELQREMARLFIKIFGDMLLTEPIKEEETVLPSPNSLKNKIILKFKKISKDDQQTWLTNKESENQCKYIDGIRRDYLYIKQSENWKWSVKMFSLSEMYLTSSEEKDYDEDDQCKERFSHELWYHGSVSSEILAEDLRSAYICFHIKMGSFFVARVDQIENDYLMLIVWGDHMDPIQLPIHVDKYKYYTINNENKFGYLEELISYYKHNDLHTCFNDANVETKEPTQQKIRLNTPIYGTDDHTKMEWFHSKMTKAQSETIINRFNKCGSFLVHNCESSPGDLTLVFCSGEKVFNRIKVLRYEKTFMFENSNLHFKSVVNMIEYFQHNEIFPSKTTLNFPITRKSANEILNLNQVTNEKIYCLEESNISEELFQTSIPHNFDMIEIFAFKLNLSPNEYIILGSKDLEEAKLWITAISEVIENIKKNKKDTEEKVKNIAKEMSDITIYFQNGDFNKAFFSNDGKGAYNEVFSLDEDKMTDIILNHPENILQFHQVSISRIYPKGPRLDSSNYDPLPFWLNGSQMVSLNYQTGDLPMQLNYALFQQNKNCGYVLRPHCSEDISNETLYLEITVLGARIFCGKKWKIDPVYVDIEIHCFKHYQIQRSILDGDSFCMISKNQPPKKHEFFIKIPQFSLLQFTVYGKTKSNFLGQYTIHVNNLREKGYRNVPLKDKNSEPLLFSSLLIYMHKWKKIELTKKMLELTNTANSSGMGTTRYQLWKKEYENLDRIRTKIMELELKKN